jgi:hypothetical protein
MDSKQIHEQLHDYSDSFSKFSQDSDVGVFDHTGPDAKTRGTDFSDSCSNSDYGQASAIIGGGGSSCRGGGYNDDNNKDWALWDEYDHNFYIPFCASYGYKPHQNGQMPVYTHKFFMLLFSATLF